MTTDHVVMDARNREFRCCHCGGSFHPALPSPMSKFMELARGFLNQHRDCELMELVEADE